jgi:hypothetical protein
MLALAAALTFPAGAANADVPTHCAPSDPAGFFACASMLVSFDATTGVITVKIQNTDVWAEDMGLNPAGWGYSITGFGIQAPELGAGVTLVGDPTIEGSVDIEGTPADEWDFTTNVNGFFVEAGASSGGVNGGILGCNDEFGNQWFRTCSGGVNTGYVVFQFDTELTDLDLAEVELVMRAQGGPVSYRCADPDGCTPTLTPEPISMLLLGTGLFGVGGVHLRRRRKEGLDV